MWHADKKNESEKGKWKLLVNTSKRYKQTNEYSNE